MACFKTPVVITKWAKSDVVIYLLASSRRDAAPSNELTKFVIAKEARRLRQSTENSRWISTSLRS